MSLSKLARKGGALLAHLHKGVSTLVASPSVSQEKAHTYKSAAKRLAPMEETTVKEVSVVVDVDEVESVNHTTMFDVPEYLATRRDATIHVTLRSQYGLSLNVEKATLVHDSGFTVSLDVMSQQSLRRLTAVKLHIPVNAPVGMFVLTICGYLMETSQPFKATLNNPPKVVVLFNPWSHDDDAYIEDAKCREEYVVNSKGRIYAGDLKGMPWNLAISRPDCLRACVMLLEEKSTLTLDQRRSPVHVSREMTALINEQDDMGVLAGNWSGDYSDGQPPTFWRGSGAILQQYFETGGEPVCQIHITLHIVESICILGIYIYSQ